MLVECCCLPGKPAFCTGKGWVPGEDGGRQAPSGRDSGTKTYNDPQIVSDRK